MSDPASISSRPRRSLGFALTAGVMLIAVAVARWGGLIYPNFAGSAVFQTGVLIGLIVAALPLRDSLPGRLGAGGWLLAAWMLFALGSSLWAPAPRLSLLANIHILFCVTWVLLTARTLRTRKDLQVILRTLFAAGILAALVGGYYVLRAHKLEALEHVQGHRNFLAMFLLPPMLFATADLMTPWLTSRERGKLLAWHPAILAAGLLVMLTAFVACQSWGGMLAGAAGVGCIIASRLTWRARVILLAAVIACILAALIILSQPAVQASMMKSAQATRWFMWKGTLRMVLERPFFGWGTGMFALHFGDFKPTEVMRYGWLTSVTLYPHNELLLVAVEGGLAALLLYLAGHLFAAGAALKASDRQADPAWRVAGWALFGAFLAMFLHGLVDIGLRYWAPAAEYWTLAGILLAWPHLDAAPPPRTKDEPAALRWATFLVGLAAAIAAMAGVVAPGLYAERLMGGRETPAGPPYVRDLERARLLSRYVPDGLYAMRTRADELLRMGKLPEAISAYEELLSIAPGYGPVKKVLGNLCLEQARRAGPRNEQAGQEALRRGNELLAAAAAANPYDASVRLAYARGMLMASKRNLPAALEQVQAAVEAAPKDAEARLMLGALLLDSGRVDEARSAADAAAALIPADSPLAGALSALRNRLPPK